MNSMVGFNFKASPHFLLVDRQIEAPIFTMTPCIFFFLLKHKYLSYHLAVSLQFRVKNEMFENDRRITEINPVAFSSLMGIVVVTIELYFIINHGRNFM